MEAQPIVSLNETVDTGSDVEIKTTRKRTRNPKSHKEYRRKCLVQKGGERESRTGNIIRKMIFKAQSECNCCQSIDIDRQRAIFNAFYEFKNWERKSLFLRSLAIVHKAKENLDTIPFTRKRCRH